MDLDYGRVVDWDTLGRPLTLLVLEALFYFALALLLDHNNRHGTSLCSTLRSYTFWWATFSWHLLSGHC